MSSPYLLSDYAADDYSQFGEDGIINYIFKQIGEGGRVCVEFGAGDGLSCSNTRHLWEQGWQALLIEGDPLKEAVLTGIEADHENVKAESLYLEPSGPNSLDAVLALNKITTIDFMSIDVDGIDFQIWAAMQACPRVVCIEYNQSIPPHVSIHQKDLNGYLGASAKALVTLSKARGYELIGLTKGNLFFVNKDELGPFLTLGRDLDVIFRYDELTYLATDYAGRSFGVGTPPWGLSDSLFTGEVNGDSIHYLGSRAEVIRLLEEEFKNPALLIGQELGVSTATEAAVQTLRGLFQQGRVLIVVDISNQANPDVCLWLNLLAQPLGYKMRMMQDKGLIVFTKEAA